jgi:hypothetical protein
VLGELQRRRALVTGATRARLAHISAWRSEINSKVANERSKMPREGELREANLNGAFLLPRLRRAESDLVTTSDVTLLH